LAANFAWVPFINNVFLHGKGGIYPLKEKRGDMRKNILFSRGDVYFKYFTSSGESLHLK
jgi:hypothetical protein